MNKKDGTRFKKSMRIRSEVLGKKMPLRSLKPSSKSNNSWTWSSSIKKKQTLRNNKCKNWGKKSWSWRWKTIALRMKYHSEIPKSTSLSRIMSRRKNSFRSMHWRSKACWPCLRNSRIKMRNWISSWRAANARGLNCIRPQTILFPPTKMPSKLPKDTKDSWFKPKSSIWRSKPT